MQIPENHSILFSRSRNQGSSDISGQFSVTSPDQDITILQQDVKSGILKFGEITDIAIPVKLSESVLSGSTINVSSALDCDPFFINRDFSFRVGKMRESFEASSFTVFPWINKSTNPGQLQEQTLLMVLSQLNRG